MKKSLPKKKSYKQMEKNFWGLPRKKQETFLKTLYSLSPVTKDVFSLWLANEEEKILERLLLQIEKETIKKIGRSRKIKVSNLNTLIKNAKAYPLSNISIIHIYYTICVNMLEFIYNVKWIATRYQKSCSKFIECYFDHLQDIAEISEREKRREEMKNIIKTYLLEGIYAPDIEALYDELL